MNFKLYRGYTLVVVSGLILLAAVVLICMNWGDVCSPHLFTKTVPDVSIGLLMLLSAGGGLVAWSMAKLLWRGVRLLRVGLANRKPPAQPAKEQGQPESIGL